MSIEASESSSKITVVETSTGCWRFSPTIHNLSDERADVITYILSGINKRKEIAKRRRVEEQSVKNTLYAVYKSLNVPTDDNDGSFIKLLNILIKDGALTFVPNERQMNVQEFGLNPIRLQPGFKRKSW